MVKRTFQPSKIHKKRVSGFRSRNSSKRGKAVLKNRRKKGRHRLSA